jgi:hypothetical protein
MVTWYVNSEGLKDLTISNKYSLLSLRVQLSCPFFQNVYKHWSAKYLEMAYIWLLSKEHFLGGFESKYTMG